MKNGIEGVAFDLDGTLYPNYRLHYKILPLIAKEISLVAAFGKARRKIRADQETSPLQQGDFYQYQAEVTAKFLNIPAEGLKEIIDKKIYRAWEPPFENIKLFKGVRKTLADLKKAGYKLGLLSDFPTDVKLKYLNLTDWDAVLCSECCGAIKPHPLSFEMLAKKMELPPEKILYVGNSRTYDVAGASRAGMKTAWIKPRLFLGKGFKKPIADFVFTNYRKLHEYVLK